jgi:hemerythrin-like domain-containing protein
MLKRDSLLTIGQPHVPDFSDPLGLMRHCHRKIEGFMKGLAAAGEVLRGERGGDPVGAFILIDSAREHFAVRGPKHTEDEEVSLFPRLREHGGGEAADALAALSELEAEHRSAEAVHAEFDELVVGLPRDGSAETEELDRFAELVALLGDLYRPHISIEDEIVFPAAARVIPPHVLAGIGREMRERRRELLAGAAGVVTLAARR